MIRSVAVQRVEENPKGCQPIGDMIQHKFRAALVLKPAPPIPPLTAQQHQARPNSREILGVQTMEFTQRICTKLRMLIFRWGRR